ncbi:MAG TPA: AAA family ATPase [Candidatus Elarobacter sp.]|nr:AAA family ATPase [Candidatus Elarobacter sp.]
MVSAPIRFQTFVGRSSELEHLLARRAEAASGRGGGVLIAGDPGIGKSRLLREFRAQLPRRTARVAATAYREFAQRPLAPLLEIVAQLDPAAAKRLHLPHATKREYLAAFVEVFEHAASSGTVVLVLEDVHWADREALEVLNVVAQRSGASRLLFVATYRDAEVGPAHPNFSLLGKLLRERTVSHIELHPLADKDVSTLLHTTDAGKALPRAALAEVRRRSDGNAFFAEELLRAAVDRLATNESIAVRPMPMSLHAAVRDRIELCSSAARALLATASLFGRRFDLDLVAAIAPPAADATSAEVAAELVRLGLIEPAPHSSEYRFRHALLREIVYDEVPLDERRALHLRIAEAVVVSPTAMDRCELLAHHFWHAGVLERAAPYCLEAGASARALHAYDDAADWYERAARGFAAAEDVARALAGAAQCELYAGRIERALESYRAAIERYAQCDRADEVVMTRVLLAAILYESGRSDEAIAEFEETRQTWSARASRVVGDRLLLRLGLLYASVRRIDAAWTCLEAIDEVAIDPESLLAAERLFLKSGLHAQRAEPVPWRADFERGFALFERLGAIPDNLRVAMSNAASQAQNLGELELARRYHARAIELAGAFRLNVDHERILLAQLELQAGNLTVARELLAEAEPSDRFASRLERTILEAWVAVATGELQRDVERGAALLEEAAAGGDGNAFARLACALATLALRRGQTRAADALFSRAAAALATAYGTAFAITALAVQRPQLAERLRALVAEAAGGEHARVSRALEALLNAAVSPPGPARRERAQDAARDFAEIGFAVPEAQALELGGDRRGALQRYREMGALGEIRRLEAASLARDGASPSDGVLTLRERELARLIAAGEGNRAVAQRLSISEKAVEKHLTSIYAKLGMTSRAQLAAYVAARRSDEASL